MDSLINHINKNDFLCFFLFLLILVFFIFHYIMDDKAMFLCKCMHIIAWQKTDVCPSERGTARTSKLYAPSTYNNVAPCHAIFIMDETCFLRLYPKGQAKRLGVQKRARENVKHKIRLDCIHRAAWSHWKTVKPAYDANTAWPLIN